MMNHMKLYALSQRAYQLLSMLIDQVCGKEFIPGTKIS